MLDIGFRPRIIPALFVGDIILDLLAVAPFDYNGILPVLVCCALLFMSALVSGSEVALFSIKPTDLDALNQSNHKSDRLIATFLNKSTGAFYPPYSYPTRSSMCYS